MRLDLIQDVERFDELRNEWNDAAKRNVDINVFLTWEWLRSWWRHFGESSPDSRLHVVLLRDGSDIVAAAPWFKVTHRAGPVHATWLQQIGYNAGDYGGVLLTSRHSGAVDALVSHLRDELRQGTSAAILSRLASDSEFLRLLRSRMAGQRGVAGKEVVVEDSVCPFAEVREGYDLQKRLRKNRVPQRLRRLGERYEVAFEYHSGPNLEDGIKHLVELHQRRWENREEEFRGLLAHAAGQAFLLDAIRAVDEAGWLRLLSLTADGRAIATRLDFEFAGRLYMLKNAIDPDFTEFAPGHLTHAHAFEQGMADGVAEIDFLRGDHPYKRRWSTGDRHLVAVTLTRPGAVGRLAATRARAARAFAARRTRR